MILALHITADICIIGLTAWTVAGYLLARRAARKRREEFVRPNRHLMSLFQGQPEQCDCPRCTAERARAQAEAN